MSPPVVRSDDRVPVRAFLLGAAAVHETLGRCHQKIRYVLPRNWEERESLVSS
jgi:hypothetical protein